MAAPRGGTPDATDASITVALEPLVSTRPDLTEPETLAAEVCRVAVAVLGGAVAVALLGPRRRDLLRVAAGQGPWTGAQVGTVWPVNAPLVDQALSSRRPAEEPDLPALAHPTVAELVESGLRSARVVPLLPDRPLADGRECLGVLCAARAAAGPFSEHERRLLDSIASLTVLHLERLELRAANADVALQRRVAFDLAEDLATSLEPRVVISRLLERLIDLVRADRGTVSWVEGDTFITEHSHDPGGTPTPRGQRLSFARLPECVEAMRTGLPVFAGPVDSGAVSSEEFVPYQGVRHRVLIPVLIGGRCVANVALSRRRDEPFDTDDLAAITPLLNVASVALHNALLYGESERARELATRAVASIARHSASTTAIPAFLTRLSATMAGLVDARAVAFWELDGATLRLVSEGQSLPGGPLDGLMEIPCRPYGRGIADQVVFRGRVRRIDARLARRARLPWVAVAGPLDALCVGWRVGDRALGMVAALGSARPEGFIAEDGWLLAIAAQAAGLVWERAEALRELTSVRDQEEERLRAAARRFAELEAVKTRFLRLASHELRGPIAVARGYMAMLAEGSLPLTGDVTKVFELVQAKLTQMNLLVDDMLETARLEDGRLELSIGSTDLRELVREVLTEMRPLAGDDVDLVLDLPPLPVDVVVDHRRVASIVSNLVDNAIKYSPGGGEIRVRLRSGEGRAALSVEDQGMGIAPEDMPALFTRFGRVVTRENSHIPGSGLGLHLARELARLHGGDLHLVSEQGRGTIATLTLPMA